MQQFVCFFFSNKKISSQRKGNSQLHNVQTILTLKIKQKPTRKSIDAICDFRDVLMIFENPQRDIERERERIARERERERKVLESHKHQELIDSGVCSYVCVCDNWIGMQRSI